MQRIDETIFYNSPVRLKIKYAPNNQLVAKFVPRMFWHLFECDVIEKFTIYIERVNMQFKEDDKVICISGLQSPEAHLFYKPLKVGEVYEVHRFQPAGSHEGQTIDRVVLRELKNTVCPCCNREPGYPAKYFKKVIV